MSIIKCTLEKDINKCPHYNPETEECNRQEPCSFGQTREQPTFVRKERWYEKYYDK